CFVGKGGFSFLSCFQLFLEPVVILGDFVDYFKYLVEVFQRLDLVLFRIAGLDYLVEFGRILFLILLVIRFWVFVFRLVVLFFRLLLRFFFLRLFLLRFVIFSSISLLGWVIVILFSRLISRHRNVCPLFFFKVVSLDCLGCFCYFCHKK